MTAAVMAIHAAGVSHDDLEWRHIHLKNDTQIMVIDFDHSSLIDPVDADLHNEDLQEYLSELFSSQ